MRSDKCRRLEGLVIEAVFNEYLSKLVRTLTVKAPPRARKHYVNAWWLWDHSTRCEHAQALSERLTPASPHQGVLFDCYYDDSARDFFIKEWGGRRDIPIQSFMLKSRGHAAPHFRMPATSVIDEHRSQQAFWAGISSQYSQDLFKRVGLHRLFKNCAIQPFFDGVWDIDSPSEFQLLGTLDDPVQAVASNIHRAALGLLDRPVDDQLLKNSRIEA